MFDYEKFETGEIILCIHDNDGYLQNGSHALSRRLGMSIDELIEITKRYSGNLQYMEIFPFNVYLEFESVSRVIDCIDYLNGLLIMNKLIGE